MPEFTGLDDLRAALEADGWRIYGNNLKSRDNLCNWIACRTDDLGLPDCRCNNKPPQFVVDPSHFDMCGHVSRSVQVSISGEAGNDLIWFKLAAYSIAADEAAEILPSVLPALASAWRAVAAPSTQEGNP